MASLKIEGSLKMEAVLNCSDHYSVYDTWFVYTCTDIQYGIGSVLMQFLFPTFSCLNRFLARFTPFRHSVLLIWLSF